MSEIDTVNILGVPIAAINIKDAISQILEWVHTNRKIYITVTGVHGIMESQYDGRIKNIHKEAGMCVPDGMPTVWIGKFYGHKNIRRVYGPDLMLEIMRISAVKGYTHFFYGGKQGVPELLKKKLLSQLPGLKIVGTFSPPFRLMNENEEIELQKQINRLSPDIIWVGLSTPKQEKWMADNIKKLNTRVMIGVGAAFDFHAGVVKQAPSWMQRIGLEWLFRLCVEPRRLWKRYLKNNPLFIWKFALQVLKIKKY